MSVDWSRVRRDDDGDWFADACDRAPGEVPIYNGHLTEGEWSNMATFAGAVALAMQGEAIERRLRDERLHSHVASALDAATIIPNHMAGLAIAAVREFEKENPVD